MAENTAEHQMEAGKTFEDTVMADEVKITEVWPWDLIPKKKKKKKRLYEYDDLLQDSKHQRYARRKRAQRAKEAAFDAAKAAAERNQELPASTTAPLHPTITTHPGSLEVDLLSGDKDEDMKEAEVEVGLDSTVMTLPFRGKPSV
ncbi:unnamed protein product [Penicillium palitans]